jgi:hypothetical protein
VNSDVLFLVRRGDVNEELRYSLRSLANVPHGRVWIAGHRPAWVSADVGLVRVQQFRGKHSNAKANLEAALRCDEISESFLYMNDDFFVMQPMESVPALHRGSIAEVAAEQPGSSDYVEAMHATRRILVDLGIPEPLSYELHVPMLVTRSGMLEALQWVNHPRIQERSLYGNLAGVGGERIEDLKVYGGETGWE